jgi:hypothetical protein
MTKKPIQKTEHKLKGCMCPEGVDIRFCIGEPKEVSECKCPCQTKENCYCQHLVSEPTQDSWQNRVKILNHEWVIRLIKLGEAKIPDRGFYVFENPYLEDFISKELQNQVEDLQIDHVKELEELDREHSNELLKQRQEIIEEIKGMKLNKDAGDFEYVGGYNQALADLLERLESK